MIATWFDKEYDYREQLDRMGGMGNLRYPTEAMFKQWDSSMFTAQAIQQARIDAEKVQEAYHNLMARKVFVLSSHDGGFLIVQHDDYKKWQMFVVRGRLAVVKREAFIEYEHNDIETLIYFGKVKWFDLGYEADENALRVGYAKMEPSIAIPPEMLEDDSRFDKVQFKMVQDDMIDRMNKSIVRSVYRPCA